MWLSRPAGPVWVTCHPNIWLGLRCFFGLSSAILFLDVSAFHHLVRETVVGSYDGKNLDPVLDTLTRTGIDAEACRSFAWNFV